MDLISLPTLAQLSNSISLVQVDALEIIRVQHPKASAAVALHGGHLISFRPTGQEEVIWMSKQTPFDGKAALRGGIPICWPWFGRIGEPSHGFARQSLWKLDEQHEHEHGVTLVLSLKSTQQTHAIWPHSFALRLRFEIGEQLHVALEATNTDQRPFTFSGALHSYFNIQDIYTAHLTGMGNRYLDKLQQGKACQGDAILQLTGAIDRIYTAPEVQIHINDGTRLITVENQGHNSAVLWNPWEEGAAALNDMQDDGYRTMICVESTIHADSLEQGVTLQPNQSWQLSTRISTHSL